MSYRQLNFPMTEPEFERFAKVADLVGDGNKTATARVALAWFCNLIEANGNEMIAWFDEDVKALPKVYRHAGPEIG